MQCIVAAAVQNCIGSIVSGKQEMPFELYEKLKGWFLMERLHEGIFACAFLALTWNLMCRGVNSCICLKHFCERMIHLVCPFLTSKMTRMAHVTITLDVSMQIPITILSLRDRTVRVPIVLPWFVQG